MSTGTDRVLLPVHQHQQVRVLVGTGATHNRLDTAARQNPHRELSRIRVRGTGLQKLTPDVWCGQR